MAEQTLCILVGLPGSGKTTLASLFTEAGWVRISQDELGDRKQCEAACSAALEAGCSVVVDRCNHNAMQRSHWLDIARRHAQRGRGSIQLLALCLELPVALCVERAVARCAHATLSPEDAPDVVHRFAAEWQGPLRREGFAAVLVARTSQQAAALAAQVLAGQALPSPAVAPAVDAAVPRQGWAQPPPGHAGQQQTTWQQQQAGWQVQQRQHYGSRADAASSWRRPANGDAAAEAAPTTDADQPARPRSPPRSPRHAAGGNNAVPFRPQREQQQGGPHHPRQHPWHKPWQRHDEPQGPPLDGGATKPILLFDANGTLTSHTSMRRSAGIHRVRPGVEHLRRLAPHFHLGLFSSASAKTIDVALALLEEAAGPGALLFDRRLVLHRSHTFLAPHTHVAAGGNDWDTVKPLRPYFRRLHRVLLVDDDSYKSCAGEEANMLLLPVWDQDDPGDRMLPHLVDTLLRLAASLGDDPDADVRAHTAAASRHLAELAAQEQARRVAATQTEEPEPAIEEPEPAAAAPLQADPPAYAS